MSKELIYKIYPEFREKRIFINDVSSDSIYLIYFEGLNRFFEIRKDEIDDIFNDLFKDVIALPKEYKYIFKSFGEWLSFIYKEKTVFEFSETVIINVKTNVNLHPFSEYSKLIDILKCLNSKIEKYNIVDIPKLFWNADIALNNLELILVAKANFKS